MWLHSECTCELGLGNFFHWVAAFWVHLRAGFRAFFPCVAACRGACEWVQGVFSIVWLHNIWLLNIWRLLRSWGAIWKLVIAKKLLQRGYLEEWVLATPFSRTLSSRITFRSGLFYIRFQIWFILQQVFIKLDKHFFLKSLLQTRFELILACCYGSEYDNF